MIDEINAQLRNHTWDLESPLRAANVVGCKWVFTIKYRADGTVERYKSRLVAKVLLTKRVLTSQIHFPLLQSLPV